MPQSNDVLALHGVSVARGGDTICRIDELHVRSGERLAVVGPNGAGKTTLLKVCCALIAPDAGRVMLGGRDLCSAGFSDRMSMISSIGYVPQISEYNADLPFTVTEIVAMGMVWRPGRRRDASRDTAMVKLAIENAKLTHLADRTFRSLSGGEQQRTLIARALVAQPLLLLMDEPGSNTDCIFRKHFRTMFASLLGFGSVSVVIVSHDLELVRSCCDRAVLLHKGRVVFDGRAADVDEDFIDKHVASAERGSWTHIC